MQGNREITRTGIGNFIRHLIAQHKKAILIYNRVMKTWMIQQRI